MGLLKRIRDFFSSTFGSSSSRTADYRQHSSSTFDRRSFSEGQSFSQVNHYPQFKPRLTSVSYRCGDSSTSASPRIEIYSSSNSADITRGRQTHERTSPYSCTINAAPARGISSGSNAQTTTHLTGPWTQNSQKITGKVQSTSFNPQPSQRFSFCSSSLCKMTITKIDYDDLVTCKCIFRVTIFDVFGKPAIYNLENNYDLKVLQYDHDVTIRKTKYFENGHLCFELVVTGKRPWSQQFAVFLNDKQISPAGKFEVSGEERVTLLQVLKRRSAVLEVHKYDDHDCAPIPEFLIYDDSCVSIPTSPSLDDGKFVQYDEQMCKLQARRGTADHELVCENTTKRTIMGQDYAHMNNIKRVLQMEHRLQVEETQPQQTTIILDHHTVPFHTLSTCRKVVLHLLRGSYYRAKAAQAANVRIEWKKRFNDLEDMLLSSPRLSPTLRFCKYFKDYYGSLMNEYNRNACDDLFSFFNYNRDKSEVDLHGLLVADEKRLESLKLSLLKGNLTDDQINDIVRKCRERSRKLESSKKDLMAGRLPPEEVTRIIESCQTRQNESQLKILEDDFLRRCKRCAEVDQIIERCRSESDEAIRKLRETLDNFDLADAMENNSPWLEIIVGAGHHSRRKGEQNIRPKVEKFLKERGHDFKLVNKGSLVVTFVEYSGPEPCFGEYYCKECDRCWKSSKSYVGKYQQCSHCGVKCWPVKQREKERNTAYRRDGAAHSKERKSKPHQSSLCQKCRELGYPCNEDD